MTLRLWDVAKNERLRFWSWFCRLRPRVSSNLFGFFLLGPPQSGTARGVCSVGKEVVRIDHLGTVTGAFDLFAGDCFRHSMLFQLEQLGVTSSLWCVTDCWSFYSAYWWCRCPQTVSNIVTFNRIEVAPIPTVQGLLRSFQISMMTFNVALLAFNR